MNNESFTDEYLIKSYYMDLKKKLRLSCVCQFFQETAFNHINGTDISYETLIQKNQVWLLSSLLIRIEKYPEWNDKIFFKTWAKGVYRLFAVRDFLVTDEAGNVLIRGTSLWLLYNFKTNRAVRVHSTLEKFPVIENEHAINHDFVKIQKLEHPVFKHIHKVRYSDMDLNQHMNSARYIDLISDSFDIGIYSNKKITEFEINYMSESVLNTEISINHMILSKESEYLINGMDKENDKEFFRSRVKFE